MQKVRIVFGYRLLVIFIKSYMYSHVICICIRVVAAVEEIVFEVVAEPQEPQGQTPQQEGREESGQGPRPNSPQSADARQAPVHVLLF